jgi:hypothetical protein
VIGATVIGGVLAVTSLASAQTPAEGRAAAEQRQMRYQIGVMERVLEGAVEHGAKETRDRWQAAMRTEMLILDNARVRGFRLEGHGVFFDVIVPSLEGTLAWSLRVLDQNDLGLNSALQTMKAFVATSGNADVEQALKRIELQVDPSLLARAAAPASTPGARNAVGSAASTGADKEPADPILADPLEAFRGEVREALMDAMLDHSSALGIGETEWLWVAARRSEDRPALAPADSDARTMELRVKGSDLRAFLARQISREEALKRIEVRVF